MAEKDFAVSLILKLNDLLSKPLEAFNKKTSASLEKLGKTFQARGAQMSKMITLPILAAGAMSIKAIGEQEEAEARFENALRITGREAEISTKKIYDLASSLQKTTIYGDDATISAAAMVQQLANLNEDQLTAAIPAIQNFASAMKIDLDSAAKIVAKTLSSENNMLSRYGVQIDNDTRGTARFNEVLGALNSKFSGTAEAVAKKGLGPLKVFKNTLDELFETIGNAILPIFNKLIAFVTPIIDGFSKLDESTRTLIIGLAGIAAAAGPVMGALGKLMSFFAKPTPLTIFALALGAIVMGVIAFNEAMKKAETAHLEQAKTIDSEIKNTRALEAEYNTLQAVVEPTIEQKKRMAQIEKELKKVVGDTAFAYDDQTGAIKTNAKVFGEYYKKKRQMLIEEMKLQEDVNLGRMQGLENLVGWLETEMATLGGENSPLNIFRRDELANKKLELAKLRNENEGLRESTNRLLAGQSELTSDIAAGTERTQRAMEATVTATTDLKKPMGQFKFDLSALSAKAGASLSLVRQSEVAVTVAVRADPGTQAKVEDVTKSGAPTVVSVLADSLVGPTMAEVLQ